MATGKIAIVGPGHVGVTLAYACLIRGTGRTIALYGRNAEKVRAEVADLAHGLQFVPMATVTGSDDVEVCRDADVLELTAGVPCRPGQRRLDLTADGLAIYRDVLPRLLEAAPGAVLVIVTNPVDVVTYAALKISGLPHKRVFGTGTTLDSSRLRSLIAQRCGVAVQNVHAYTAGEHGESQVPLWTSATAGGVPLLRCEDKRSAGWNHANLVVDAHHPRREDGHKPKTRRRKRDERPSEYGGAGHRHHGLGDGA